MLPVEVLPDAELAVLTYLRTQVALRAEAYLTGLTFGNWINPTTLPFAAVRRIGGTSPATPGWDTARIVVQVWAATAADRSDIAQMLRALLTAAHGPVGTYALAFAAEVLGPTSLPDPADATKQVVQFTHELNVRSVA